MTNVVKLLAVGNEQMRKLQFAEAEKSFRKAIELDSRSADALAALARLALMKKESEKARELLDRALSFHPHNALALAVKGIYFMDAEDFDQAIEVLERAKSSDPKLQMAYFNLGTSYSEIGQFEKAEQAFRTLVEMDPKHFEAHSQLSHVQLQTGRMEEGIRSMLRAIRINPLFIKGYLILGSLYENAGKGELMLRLYRHGLKHNPGALPLRERLCALYALKLDFLAAYKEALEIVRRRPADPAAYLRLGSYAVALRKFGTAEKAFQTSIEMNTNGWEGHYNLGELYMSASRIQEARKHYKAAVENNNANYKPLNGMGFFLLMVEHDWDGAIRLFTQALELAPTRPEPRLNMALAYAKKRDFQSAERFALSVLKLVKPDDRMYVEAQRLRRTIRGQVRLSG